ncbi:hypothetical protein SH501x_004826 [Pirellulaceae bacterium SH501]
MKDTVALLIPKGGLTTSTTVDAKHAITSGKSAQPTSVQTVAERKATLACLTPYS